MKEIKYIILFTRSSGSGSQKVTVSTALVSQTDFDTGKGGKLNQREGRGTIVYKAGSKIPT
jgi:hypothetical protein